jgi:hypothetical protein
MNVLADEYDQFASHLSQFYFWIKYWTKTSGGKASEFSLAAQAQLHDLSNRVNTIMTSIGQEVGDTLGKKPRYLHDPTLISAALRMIASANAMKTLKAQADALDNTSAPATMR